MISNIILFSVVGCVCVAYIIYTIVKIVKIKNGTWKKKPKEGDDE